MIIAILCCCCCFFVFVCSWLQLCVRVCVWVCARGRSICDFIRQLSLIIIFLLIYDICWLLTLFTVAVHWLVPTVDWRHSAMCVVIVSRLISFWYIVSARIYNGESTVKCRWRRQRRPQQPYSKYSTVHALSVENEKKKYNRSLNRTDVLFKWNNRYDRSERKEAKRVNQKKKESWIAYSARCKKN